ncbi:MAG: TVP38/TMEM64 family protein [Thermodesulfobacteriota bacterium]
MSGHRTSRLSSDSYRHIRLVAVVLTVALLLILAHYLGIQEFFNLRTLRKTIADAGAWGYLLYILLFVIGEICHVFGLLFVAAGVYVYGRTTGFILAMVGGTVAICVSFQLMRLIGGRPFSDIEKPWIRRILSRLDQQPVRSIIFLRTFLLLHPSLNYAMALTNIRFRDYVIGSVLGLLAPIGLFVLFFDWLVENLPGI